MFNVLRLSVLALCSLLIVNTAAIAQQPNAGTSPTLPTFKVEVVLSRFQGTKRISTMPYVLVVNSAPPGRPDITTLRVGVDAPTGRSVSSTSNGVTTTSPEYKYVGTSIDCWILTRNTTTYDVRVNLQDYSLASQSNSEAAAPPARFDLAIRNFSVTNTLAMREGQAVEFSVGTDPVTGETIRASVTVSAIK